MIDRGYMQELLFHDVSDLIGRHSIGMHPRSKPSSRVTTEASGF